MHENQWRRFTAAGLIGKKRNKTAGGIYIQNIIVAKEVIIMFIQDEFIRGCMSGHKVSIATPGCCLQSFFFRNHQEHSCRCRPRITKIHPLIPSLLLLCHLSASVFKDKNICRQQTVRWHLKLCVTYEDFSLKTPNVLQTFWNFHSVPQLQRWHEENYWVDLRWRGQIIYGEA